MRNDYLFSWSFMLIQFNPFVLRFKCVFTSLSFHLSQLIIQNLNRSVNRQPPNLKRPPLPHFFSHAGRQMKPEFGVFSKIWNERREKSWKINIKIIGARGLSHPSSSFPLTQWQIDSNKLSTFFLQFHRKNGLMLYPKHFLLN